MPGNNHSNNQNDRSNNQNGHTNNQNQQTTNDSVLRAPFNFVPLPTTGEPVIPEWGNQVSLDIPFKVGLSGKITFDITAVTDIFVRDGSGDRSSLFSQVLQDGKPSYFIPGSSIKGALRSMLEIVTFGKLTQFNNDSFSIRDLTDKSYTSKMADGYNSKVYGGWLYKDLNQGNYKLQSCGKVDEGLQLDMDKEKAPSALKNSPFYEWYDYFVHNGENFKNDSNKTAIIKYCHWIKSKEDVSSEQLRSIKNNWFKAFEFEGKCLVFTGQSSVRKYDEKRQKWVGKHIEFLFPIFEPKKKDDITLNENVVLSFKSIHKNSTDYLQLWSGRLEEGLPIPVFYIKEGKKKEGEKNEEEKYVIGLTKMFRYPAAYNVASAILPESLRTKTDKDFAELMFGYTDKNDSLKGRVHVGHAFMKEGTTPKPQKGRRFVLGSPHPSYYPLYLADSGEIAQTWNSAQETMAKIAGFKRYPVRTTVVKPDLKGVPESVISKVIPLGKDSKFSTTIMFHNLKPEELGALLYVLKEPKFHQLGGLKPYGYGRVKLSEFKIEFRSIGDEKFEKEDFYIETFKTYMQNKSSGSWENSETLKELFAMCGKDKIPSEGDVRFTYMNMAKKEFVTGKNEYVNGKRLGTFTQIMDGQVPDYSEQVAANRSQNQGGGNNHKKVNRNSIEFKEHCAGWKIEEKKTYKGKIFDDGLCIFHPDRNSDKKAIINKVKFESSSKNLQRGVTFSFTILKKNDESVVIQVNNRPNRYYR